MGNILKQTKEFFCDLWDSLIGFEGGLVLFDCREFDFYVEGNFEVNRCDENKVEESEIINKIKFD